MTRDCVIDYDKPARPKYAKRMNDVSISLFKNMEAVEENKIKTHTSIISKELV